MRIVLGEVFESGQIATVDPFRILHLNRVKATFSVNDEVNLDS